jgi:hypothetical protein
MPAVKLLEKSALAAEVEKSLFARDGHAIDPQRWRSSRPAKFQVIANLRNIIEHVFEIARDRHLFHWISKLAIFNPQPAHSAGKITGDRVHAKAEKLEDVESLLYVANDLLRRAFTFLQIEIA